MCGWTVEGSGKRNGARIEIERMKRRIQRRNERKTELRKKLERKIKKGTDI
jgi:hypothetical protein